jgi:hypothetical protein
VSATLETTPDISSKLPACRVENRVNLNSQSRAWKIEWKIKRIIYRRSKSAQKVLHDESLEARFASRWRNFRAISSARAIYDFSDCAFVRAANSVQLITRRSIRTKSKEFKFALASGSRNSSALCLRCPKLALDAHAKLGLDLSSFRVSLTHNKLAVRCVKARSSRFGSLDGATSNTSPLMQ